MSPGSRFSEANCCDVVPAWTPMRTSLRSAMDVALAAGEPALVMIAEVVVYYGDVKSTAFLRSSVMENCWMFRSQSFAPGVIDESKVARTHWTLSAL